MQQKIESLLQKAHGGCFIDLYGARCCKITINKRVRLKWLMMELDPYGKIFVDTYSYNSKDNVTSFQFGTWKRLFPVKT